MPFCGATTYGMERIRPRPRPRLFFEDEDDFHQSPQLRWGARCEVRKKMADESPPGRGKGRQALGWVVVLGTDPPRRSAPPLPRGDSLKSIHTAGVRGVM